MLPQGPGAGTGEVALTAATDALATELLAALDANGRLDPITDRVPGFDVDAAYRVGAEILRRRRARGETPVGRKVGFTNRTIWAEYGVFAPVWGFMYDSTVRYQDGLAGRLAIGHLAQPRIEPEIVLHFSRAPHATEDDEELLSSIDWIAHGFEIVQSHFPGWKFRAADTVAAFGLHGALVVGPKRAIEGGSDLARELRTFSITLARNGQVQAEGGGWSVLGSPLRAAAHLLRVLESQPAFEPIRAGEVVTTGTLTRAWPICAGETWSTELSGIELPGLQLRLE